METAIIVYVYVLAIVATGFLLKYFPRGFVGLISSIAIDGVLWFCSDTKFVVTHFFIVLMVLEIWGTAFLFYWDERVVCSPH